jgi:hypothetical protein
MASTGPTPIMAEAAMHRWPAQPVMDAAMLAAVISSSASGNKSSACPAVGLTPLLADIFGIA